MTTTTAMASLHAGLRARSNIATGDVTMAGLVLPIDSRKESAGRDALPHPARDLADGH